MDREEKKSGYTNLVPAVDEASRMLIIMAENISFRMNLTEICKKTGIHKSKAFSILNTLQKYGFVYKNPADKTYSLGPGLISLSRKVLDNLDYKDVVNPYIEELALKTGCTALFGVINGDNLFVIAKHEAGQKIGVTIRLGHRFHLTAGAHGKSIVAFLSEEEKRLILNRDKLYFYGESSRLDRKRLDDELTRCVEVGFAYDVGELSKGINAIASPVFNARGNVIGSIFIVGTFFEQQIDILGKEVFKAAFNVSRMLGAEAEKLFYPAIKNLQEVNNYG